LRFGNSSARQTARRNEQIEDDSQHPTETR
jgi:hypothetical protein